MDSDSDIIYDSEPDRLADAEGSSRPSQATRNRLRRTSDERPGLSSEGSTAGFDNARRRAKHEIEPAREVLVLDSGSEDGGERECDLAATTKSKYFPPTSSSPKRRRTRSPPLDDPRVPASPEGWPFSGEVRIGSRSPPLSSRRASCRSLSIGVSQSPPLADPAPVASTSRHSPPAAASRAASPFTSALDLLHSRSAPSADPFADPDSPRGVVSRSKPRPTQVVTSSTSSRSRSRPEQPSTTKSTLALDASQSASSIEIFDLETEAKGRTRKKGKEKQIEENDDMSLHRSVSPETWVEQFTLKKGKELSSTPGAGKDEAAPSQDVKRTKPWDAIEAKLGSTSASKKKQKKERSTVVVKKKPTRVMAKQTRDEVKSDEDDDVNFLTSGSGSSTALKPCPSGRLSHLAPPSTAFTKRKPTKSRSNAIDEASPRRRRDDSNDVLFSDAPRPLVLPSDDRLKCLSHCPLCAFASSHDRARTSVDSWGTKSLAARQSHLRVCAKSHDYSSETVSHLVNQQVLVLGAESEDRRLERDLGKSLFDRAIGRGEGASGREVTVVGTEGTSAQEGDKEWCREVQEIQDEVDGWRKKTKKGGIEDRLARVAKDIRRELEAAAAVVDEQLGEEREAGSEAGGRVEEVPRATGRLRPETESDRDQVAKRARELLDLAHGTQTNRKAVFALDGDSSTDANERDRDETALPPSTQPFEDSILANRCEHDGAIDILRPLASSPPAGEKSKTRSRSPLHEIDLAFSSDEDESSRRSTSSLWTATVGNDEGTLSRVVCSRPVLSGSPLYATPPRAVSSPLAVVTPASALNPDLSTLTLSSSPSPSASSSLSCGSSLPRPSTLFNLGSSRGLATSTRKIPRASPTPRRAAPDAEHEPEELGNQVERLGLGGSRPTDGNDEWMDGGDGEWEMEEGMVMVGGAETSGTGKVAGGTTGAESSEEEALVDLVARTPIKSRGKVQTKTKATRATSPTVDALTKSTTRRTRVSPSSDSGSPSEQSGAGPAPAGAETRRAADPPGMPAYSSLPLSTLQKEVQKYGYRPSKEKSVVVQQLKDVWKAINKEVVDKWERGELPQVPAKKTARTKSQKTGTEEASSNAAKKSTKGRRRRRVAPDESGEDEVEEGETRTVGERLRELIVNEEELYLRILRYEPIHIDEFILLAANNKVKVARQLLIRCLDEQSITFYQEDPTNGQRKRHK